MKYKVKSLEDLKYSRKKRADNHYDISIKTEEGIDIIIEHLENQNELLNKILNK